MTTGTTTLCRNGAWKIELMNPIKQRAGEITEIVINPPDFDCVIRWGNGQIESTLGLLAELSNLPEPLLKCMVYPDVDRTMMALASVVPQIIRDDFNNQTRPVATSIANKGPTNEMVDPIDPRFPKVPGPIQRFTEPQKPQTQEPQDDGSGFSAGIPDVAKAV